jgi:hypothetical protein
MRTMFMPPAPLSSKDMAAGSLTILKIPALHNGTMIFSNRREIKPSFITQGHFTHDAIR